MAEAKVVIVDDVLDTGRYDDDGGGGKGGSALHVRIISVSARLESKRICAILHAGSSFVVTLELLLEWAGHS